MFEPRDLGIEQELSEKIDVRVVNHRNRFARIFYSRYLELLPTTIKYYNGYKYPELQVDWLKVEVMLRSNYDVIIGETLQGNIRILGISKRKLTPSDPANILITKPLSGKDIQWVIPKDQRLPRMKEITDIDGAQSGNFVVIRNKVFAYNSDYEIIQHYTSELAEIVLSRYSLKMQAKISTFLIGEPNDQTVNNIAESLYNGSPITKVTGFFDPDEHIKEWNNSNVGGMLAELKREYQNTLNELNAILGFSSLGVDKESGVTETESNSGKAYTTANGNIYLTARNNACKLLNKRYGFEIHPLFDDNAISTLTVMTEGGSSNGSDNSLFDANIASQFNKEGKE